VLELAGVLKDPHPAEVACMLPWLLVHLTDPALTP
jgi:hypothetical protein